METAKTPSFSIKEAIVYGWEMFKRNFKFLLITVIIYAVVDRGFSLLHVSLVNNMSHASPLQNTLDVILTVIEVIISLSFTIGFIRIALALLDGKKPQFAFLWDNWSRKMWHVFLATLLYLLVVFVGLVLLIVPGVYFAIKYQYLIYFVVEKNMGPIEAFKASGKLTQGNMWKLFLFALTLFVIAGAAFLAFSLVIVGVVEGLGEFGVAIVVILGLIGMIGVFLVTSPLITLMHTYVYRKLSRGHISEPKDLSSDISLFSKAS